MPAALPVVGPDDALRTLDEAIARVSSTRVGLGSLENRLGRTVSRLGVAVENTTAAYSRIRDTDLAQDMTGLSRNQLLLQAGSDARPGHPATAGRPPPADLTREAGAPRPPVGHTAEVITHAHRTRTAATGSYKGHGVHAAPGVHEYAVELVRAALPRGGRVLEVGAGCGALACRLQDAGFDVVPTDIDPPHDWIHPLDLDDPQWTEETRGPFDMVVCVETLEHVENPRQVLRSIRALLRPGDRLLVSTPNITHPHSRLKMFLKGAPFIFGPDHYHQPGHISILPDWMLREHIRLAGFTDITVTTGGSTWYEGRRQLIHRVETALLRLVGLRHRAESGEGICTFVTAVAE